MKRNAGENKTRILSFIIRALILIIFCVAIVLTVNRLAEFRRRNREAAELEKEKAKIEEQQRQQEKSESPMP